MEFHIGDRVQRVSGQHLGMEIGDVGTVVGITEGGGLALKEYRGRTGPGAHTGAKFILVARAAQAAASAPAARKDDSGKLDMNLLDDMPRALKAVVEVMQWAITDKKPVPYVRGSWLAVHADRYRAAIKRHERSAAEQATAPSAHAARFQRDDETQLLHLAHTACSAMMALENTLREMEASK